MAMFIITGANGFIGSALTWQFNQKNLGPIIAVDSVSQEDRPAPLANRQIEQFLLKDQLFDFLNDNCSSSKQPSKIKWIIHLGACSSTTETDKNFLDENNTEYTKKIFNWSKENNVPIIYASSGAVYGGGENGFSDNRSPNDFTPLNLYGESKAAFDRWIINQESSKATMPPHWYGLRFFNVYGPGEDHKNDMASVVYKAYLQLQEKDALTLFRSHNRAYKDGFQERDFVYVKDITNWILELIDRKPKSGIYNMGFGKARPWMALANTVFENMKKPTTIDWIDIPKNIRNQYQYTTKAEMNKAIDAGLSEPSWPLEDGITDYIQHLLKNKSTGGYL